MKFSPKNTHLYDIYNKLFHCNDCFRQNKGEQLFL